MQYSTITSTTHIRNYTNHNSLLPCMAMTGDRSHSPPLPTSTAGHVVVLLQLFDKRCCCNGRMLWATRRVDKTTKHNIITDASFDLNNIVILDNMPKQAHDYGK